MSPDSVLVKQSLVNYETFITKACNDVEYEHVDTLHEIDESMYILLRNRFYTTPPLPTPKVFSYGDIKACFGSGCRYVMFNFTPGIRDNSDITPVSVLHHNPFNSSYSVALFKRIQQLHNLHDTDKIEFVKSMKMINGIENIRVIFKVEKNQNSYFYDISENPKKKSAS